MARPLDGWGLRAGQLIALTLDEASEVNRP